MCSRFIGFIKDNNGMGPGTESERIALLKATIKKYEGKRVRSRSGEETVITRVFPNKVDEVLMDKSCHPSVQLFSPFLLSHTVAGKGGKKQGTHSCVSRVTLLE